MSTDEAVLYPTHTGYRMPRQYSFVCNSQRPMVLTSWGGCAFWWVFVKSPPGGPYRHRHSVWFTNGILCKKTTSPRLGQEPEPRAVVLWYKSPVSKDFKTVYHWQTTPHCLCLQSGFVVVVCSLPIVYTHNRSCKMPFCDSNHGHAGTYKSCRGPV